MQPLLTRSTITRPINQDWLHVEAADLLKAANQHATVVTLQFQANLESPGAVTS